MTEGASIDQTFRVGDKQVRVNRDGAKYLLLKLFDRTGTIVAMWWNVGPKQIDSFDRGDFVHCVGRTQVHKGALQIIATRVQWVDQDDVDTSDYERFDSASADRAMSELRDIVDAMQSPPLVSLIDAFLKDQSFTESFRTAAAAVSNHHAYPGGLLRHTVDLMRLAELIAPRYTGVDVDLVITGAFLHDLGKIRELGGGDEIAYSDEGQLLGHIVIGLSMLESKLAQLDPPMDDRMALQLKHLVTSHHGVLEFGSPRVPQTLEAVLLHHIDNMDAKLTSYQSVIESDVGTDPNWTNYHPGIGRKLWRGE